MHFLTLEGSVGLRAVCNENDAMTISPLHLRHHLHVTSQTKPPEQDDFQQVANVYRQQRVNFNTS